MDGGVTRRGKPCWYRLEEVGLRAMNDAVLIHSLVFILLREKFSDLDCFMNLVQLFSKTAFITNEGQTCDMIVTKKNIVTLDMDEYKELSFNKTGFYSVCLPLFAGMHLAG